MNKFKILLLLFGFFILYFLLKKVGFSSVIDQVRSMGWTFLFLIFFPVFFQEVLFALAWQYSINGRVPGFLNVFFANIAGESVSYITPFTFVGGEPLRAILLKHHAGGHSSTASVIISRTTRAMGMVVFVSISLFMSLNFLPLPGALKTILIVVLTLLFIGIFIFIYLQKIGIFATISNWINWIKLPGWASKKVNHFIQEKGINLQKLDQQLIDFYKNEPGRFCFSLVLSVIGWAIGALEIYLFLKFIGMPVSIYIAVSIEALSLVINTCFLFMPAGIGTQEAGKVFIFKVLGMLAQTGLAVGVFRRIREIIWAFLGLGIFAFYKMAKPLDSKA